MPSTLLKKAKLPVAYQCCFCQPRKRSRRNPPFRTYASGYEFRDNMNWPCRRNSSFTPSPYEIFDLEKSAAYSKRKFYELVKIYHPDRNEHNSSDGLTHIERLERYRLIVQAHEILSDPAKRKQYDISGVGWGTSRTIDRYSRGFTNAEGKRYGFGPEDDSSIFQNATWEDWERWYRRHDPPKYHYEPYLHPNAFASIVILLAVLSGVLMATRGGQFSGSIEEKAQAFTEETGRFLASRKDHFEENEIKSTGRVKHFLEKRDPSKYGLKEEEEEVYRKHFANSVLEPAPNLKGSEKGQPL
ncbi:J domain-containing protein 1 [Cladophialophora chaetospira]|uniref:J domain-containing protein 1 n=1 Tax=Cladophialophora chaetospira TaxID=386627 RepID=A0AA38XCR6_9EURO|nr:J domain-containing protein 1 [Cladophialophora chaetospira]